MGSGFNGQQFQFNGYLPIDDKACRQKIQELEGQSKRHDISQIFMETPYRNSAMITRILSQCRDETRLCIACDISLDTEEIISKPISEWKKLQKHPDHAPQNGTNVQSSIFYTLDKVVLIPSKRTSSRSD